MGAVLGTGGIVSHTECGVRTRIISARRATRKERKLYEEEGGVRGKYLERDRSGTNLALLAPDVRAAFPTDEAVNQALRSLIPGHHPA